MVARVVQVNFVRLMSRLLFPDHERLEFVMPGVDVGEFFSK